jgi:hypothetical protein
MKLQELSLKVFAPVAERVIQRKDSLESLQRFPKSGIEGWLKVEAVVALGGLVCKLHNRGPDIELTDGTLIELKAATDLNSQYIRKGVSKCPSCLFLGDGRNRDELARLDGSGINVVAHRLFYIGESKWVIGLLQQA